MQTFANMRVLAELRRRHLPFLKTSTEVDMAREIGHHQVLGAPITLKQLAVSGIGSMATLQRALQRLKRLGLVREKRSLADKRAVELTLSPGAMRAFSQYGTGLATFLQNAASAATQARLRHVCALCDGERGARDVALLFIREGLRRGQRNVFVGPAKLCESILSDARFKRWCTSGRLSVYTGNASTDVVLGELQSRFEQARKAGQDVRLVGDMTWAVEKCVGVEALLGFESRLDHLARRFRVEIVCAYDVRHHSSRDLFRVLKTHPDANRYPLILS